jgi:hypothetical protein
MRDLRHSEIVEIEGIVEDILNENIFTLDCLKEDEDWDGEGESIEEKVIKEMIKILQSRVDNYK